MNKTLQFDVLEEMVVRNEAFSGLALTFGTVQADGITLAALSDYNKVAIDLILERNGKAPVYLFEGYLQDLIIALYGQTPQFALNQAAYGLTHRVLLEFGALHLRNGDTFRVKVKAQKTTFTSLSTVQSGTYIRLETVPTNAHPGGVAVVRTKSIGNGETNIDIPLGSNVVKVTSATDYGAAYFASTKAKFDSFQISARGFEKNISREVLEIENIHMLRDNPESDIEDMVLFVSDNPIQSANLRGKLDKAADSEAKILIVGVEHV